MENASMQSSWKIIGIIFILLFITSSALAVLFGTQLASTRAQMALMGDVMDEMEDDMMEMEDKMDEMPEGTDLVDTPSDLEAWEFDPNTIQLGDTVAGTQLSGIELFRGERESGSFFFSGEIEVTGDWDYAEPGAGIIQDQVCMRNLDEASLERVPYAISDTRDVWFCFENTGVALDLLGTESGRSTVVIDRYQTRLIQGEVLNSALLVSVESAE